MKEGKSRVHKRVLTGVISIFLIIAPVFFADAASGEPRLRVTPDRFDFGVLEEGDPAITTVTVENVGKRIITITNIQTN